VIQRHKRYWLTSRGGNICTTIIIRILEHHTAIPRPVSIILAYPALDFNFTSWMSPANLRVLRTEHSENHIPGLKQGKDHMSHKSPLSVVDDVKRPHRTQTQSRQRSWGEAISSKLPGLAMSPTDEKSAFGGSKTPKGTSPAIPWSAVLPRVLSEKLASTDQRRGSNEVSSEDSGSSDDDDDTRTVRAFDMRREADKSLRERVKTPKEERHFDLKFGSPEKIVPVEKRKRRKAPIGTRMTMTSRVGYFQDRIISPSMVSPLSFPSVRSELMVDASNGYPLYRPSTESRLRDGLLYFTSSCPRSLVGSFPASLPHLRRARSIRRRYCHLLRPSSRGQTRPTSRGRIEGSRCIYEIRRRVTNVVIG